MTYAPIAIIMILFTGITLSWHASSFAQTRSRFWGSYNGGPRSLGPGSQTNDYQNRYGGNRGTGGTACVNNPAPSPRLLIWEDGTIWMNWLLGIARFVGRIDEQGNFIGSLTGYKLTGRINPDGSGIGRVSGGLACNYILTWKKAAEVPIRNTTVLFPRDGISHLPPGANAAPVKTINPQSYTSGRPGH